MVWELASRHAAEQVVRQHIVLRDGHKFGAEHRQ